jgi:16S rRNA (uracil1498-N3)-methyltransferase
VKQLVVAAIPEPGEVIELTQEQHHYLARVRRVSQGTKITCVDAAGRRGQAVVVAAASSATSLRLQVREREEPPTTPEGGDPRIAVTLYVALLKGKKLDTVVRQVTELGVDRIVPVITRHCVSRPAPDDLLKKSRRWEEIAKEATQQSGRSTVPALAPPAVLHDLGAEGAPDSSSPALSLVFHEAADRVLTIPGALNSSTTPGEIRALVGPEGGLAQEEVEYLSGGGWQVRRMPTPVLRAETAAVAAATLVQSLRSEYTATAS